MLSERSKRAGGDGEETSCLLQDSFEGGADSVAFAGAWRLGVIVRVNSTVLQSQITYNPKIHETQLTR